MAGAFQFMGRYLGALTRIGPLAAGEILVGETGKPPRKGVIRTKVLTGRNGAGAVTAAGLSVGDKVVGAVNLTDGTDASADFEATITVAGQIQQAAVGDLSAKKHVFTVLSR